MKTGNETTEHRSPADGSGVRLSNELDYTGHPRPPHGRRWWPALVCLSAYSVLAMLDFGHFGSLGANHVTGPGSADEIQDVWWIAWAYRALTHVYNPFFTDWLNYPAGFNAFANSSMLGLGVLSSPITFFFGPVVSWNLLERAAPFLSAFSMCLVLRRWTRWWPAAFVGGLLYGFSSYVLSSGPHLNLAFVPLPSVFFLLLYEVLVRQRWEPKRTGALLGLVCAVQYFIWPEVLASMVMFGLGAMLLWLLANRGHIPGNRDYLKTAGLYAVLVAAVLLVYPLLHTLFGPQHINGVPNPPSELAPLHGDVFGLLVPGYFQRLAIPGQRPFYLTNSVTMYLGFPLLLAIGLIVVVLRRCRIVLLAGALALVSLILSFGSTLYIGGHDTHLPLPFAILLHLPLTQGFLSTRFSLYTILFGSAIVAIGLDVLHQRLIRSRGLAGFTPRRREIVAFAVTMAIALVVAVPTLPLHQQSTFATNASSSFFSSLEASGNIPEGSALLAYPYSDNPTYPGTALDFSYSWRYQSVNAVMLDQALSGMNFRLIGGYSWRPSGAKYGEPSPNDLYPQSVKDLFDYAFYGVATRSGQAKVLSKSDIVADLRTFVRAHNVDTVVVLPLGQHPAMVTRFLTAALGQPSPVRGALAWFDVEHRLKTVAPGTKVPFAPPPPVTQVVRPSPGTQWQGSQYLAATASASVGIDRVVFRLTGRGHTVVEPGRTYRYGWLARWDTTTVPNGIYTVHSVAYGVGGQVTTSGGVMVRVNNP